MRIIKKGEIPAPVEKIKVCSNCKTEFTYTESDLRYSGNTCSIYVYCPICKEATITSMFDRKVKNK